MPIGLNRRNDTPIGGSEEFRANLDDTVWAQDEVPTWDGTKFVPGSSVALLTAYGGLASDVSISHTADGSVVNDWDEVTPLNGTPEQTTPNAVTGTITVDVSGVFAISVTLTLSNLANNQDYVIEGELNGTPMDYAGVIRGSNNVFSQSSSFALLSNITAGDVFAITITNGSSSTYDIVSASISITRIGI
jgi:hypothetical protein